MNAAVHIETHKQSKKEPTVTGMNFGHTFSIVRDLAYRLSLKPLFCNYRSILLKAPQGMEESAPSIQYVGDGTQLAYLKSLCSEQPYAEHESRKLTLVDVLLKRWQHSDQALIVYDFDFPLHYLLKLPGLALPYWIKQKIELNDDWDAYLARMRRKTRREAQRMIRKFELHTHVVSGEDYAEEFYDNLYAPYIRSRHGDSAVVIDRTAALSKLRSSQIVQLLVEDKVIGAAQIDTQGSVLALGWTGLTDLQDKPELRGAADALDYFCMKYAFDSGCKVIDMGHSRSVLSDGILKYKKKWGANVSVGVVPQGLMKFEVRELSKACHHFLSSNPMLSVTDSNLEAHVVLPHKLQEAKEIEAYIADLFVEGIVKIHVYYREGLAAGFDFEGVPCAVQMTQYSDVKRLADYLNQ